MGHFPKPENGMVVRFRYKWADSKQPEKDRPACIAFVASPSNQGLTEIAYLPISTSPPRDDQIGIEIPPQIISILTLSSRSWVIVSECNLQFWPNDIAQIPGRDGHWVYGFVPPRFFAKIVQVFRIEIARRTENIRKVHYLPARRGT